MSRSRSSNAARYGALAERAAAERYALELEHTSWYDARDRNGRPVEIKSAMLNRASGKEGRFRIFEEYHKRLVDENGSYVFVSYRAVGRGIQIGSMRSLSARSLRIEFYGAGGHRDSNQAKIPISRLL
jgi:hypothetical protein